MAKLAGANFTNVVIKIKKKIRFARVSAYLYQILQRHQEQWEQKHDLARITLLKMAISANAECISQISRN